MVLHIVENLLIDLNESDVNYCHWKSNEHLDASVNGDTDLDILFDSSQREDVINILTKNGFHLFDAVWYKKYFAIVDYIGFDIETGKTVHVHSHFKLDLGEVGIKSYQLPWDQEVLSRRIYNETFNIYTSSPDMEYLLLVVRTAFKKDALNYRSNRRIVDDFNREAKWLYPLTSVEKVKLLSEKLLNREMSLLIEQIRLDEEYNQRRFNRLQGLLKMFFKDYRILSSKKVIQLKTIYYLNAFKKRLNRIPGINFKFPRRNLPHNGIVVSLMGADGSGKSTQTELILKEFKKKVDVHFFYMGSGKGEKSLQRKIVDSIFDVLLRIRTKSSSSNKNTNQVVKKKVEKSLSEKGFLTQLILSTRAISLAFERKTKLKQIAKEKDKGAIVICDRYPQTETPGFNDGLRLIDNLNSKNKILRSLAKYETKCFELTNKIFPDLVIKFHGDVDLLHSRRPEMNREDLAAKQEGILKLKFTNKTKIVKIEIEDRIDTIKSKIIHEISTLITEKSM